MCCLLLAAIPIGARDTDALLPEIGLAPFISLLSRNAAGYRLTARGFDTGTVGTAIPNVSQRRFTGFVACIVLNTPVSIGFRQIITGWGGAASASEQ